MTATKTKLKPEERLVALEKLLEQSRRALPDDRTLRLIMGSPEDNYGLGEVHPYERAGMPDASWYQERALERLRRERARKFGVLYPGDVYQEIEDLEKRIAQLRQEINLENEVTRRVQAIAGSQGQVVAPEPAPSVLPAAPVPPPETASQTVTTQKPVVVTTKEMANVFRDLYSAAESGTQVDMNEALGRLQEIGGTITPEEKTRLFTLMLKNRNFEDRWPEIVRHFGYLYSRGLDQYPAPGSIPAWVAGERAAVARNPILQLPAEERRRMVGLGPAKRLKEDRAVAAEAERLRIRSEMDRLAHKERAELAKAELASKERIAKEEQASKEEDRRTQITLSLIDAAVRKANAKLQQETEKYKANVSAASEDKKTEAMVHIAEKQLTGELVKAGLSQAQAEEAAKARSEEDVRKIMIESLMELTADRTIPTDWPKRAAAMFALNPGVFLDLASEFGWWQSNNPVIRGGMKYILHSVDVMMRNSLQGQ